MKFDQDLCATCDMNSTLGSVVPLAMFSSKKGSQLNEGPCETRISFSMEILIFPSKFKVSLPAISFKIQFGTHCQNAVL